MSFIAHKSNFSFARRISVVTQSDLFNYPSTEIQLSMYSSPSTTGAGGLVLVRHNRVSVQLWQGVEEVKMDASQGNGPTHRTP